MVEKQARFARTISGFIPKAFDMGYLLNFGEAWRPEILAQMYKKLGKGITNSLHWSRLAIDLNAYVKVNGIWVYLDASEKWHIPHLEKLGELWKSLDKDAAWGGDFSKKDQNHYSFQHNGVR
jgi:hypothetical protein